MQLFWIVLLFFFCLRFSCHQLIFKWKIIIFQLDLHHLHNMHFLCFSATIFGKLIVFQFFLINWFFSDFYKKFFLILRKKVFLGFWKINFSPNMCSCWTLFTIFLIQFFGKFNIYQRISILELVDGDLMTHFDFLSDQNKWSERIIISNDWNEWLKQMEASDALRVRAVLRNSELIKTRHFWIHFLTQVWFTIPSSCPKNYE